MCFRILKDVISGTIHLSIKETHHFGKVINPFYLGTLLMFCFRIFFKSFIVNFSNFFFSRSFVMCRAQTKILNKIYLETCSNYI